MSPCPLCSSPANFFFKDRKRAYCKCSCCELIFVPKQFHLSASRERMEYDYHQNDSSDQGYRDFLGKIIDPLEKHLKPGMEGLDFGSGPGPTLFLMLQERGFHMKIYDPFYADDPALLKREYDFVTCTEVVEHFCSPKNSWALLSGLVKKGGCLAIMTLFWDAEIEKNFSGWWYKNNETHVVFYSRQTLSWIENHFSIALAYSDERIALFKKLGGSS